MADEVRTLATRTEESTGQIQEMIAGAAEQQSGVSRELDQSVSHIAQLAEQAVKGGEQIASASGELAKLGDDLRDLVSRFET